VRRVDRGDARPFAVGTVRAFRRRDRERRRDLHAVTAPRREAAGGISLAGPGRAPHFVVAKPARLGLVIADAREDREAGRPTRRDAALPRPSRAAARALPPRRPGCPERL